MSIDWASFTPGSAAIGGVIIGIAVAMFAFVNGRIAGVSGIVGIVATLSFMAAGFATVFVARHIIGN